MTLYNSFWSVAGLSTTDPFILTSPAISEENLTQYDKTLEELKIRGVALTVKKL